MQVRQHFVPHRDVHLPQHVALAVGAAAHGGHDVARRRRADVHLHGAPRLVVQLHHAARYVAAVLRVAVIRIDLVLPLRVALERDVAFPDRHLQRRQVATRVRADASRQLRMRPKKPGSHEQSTGQ